MLPPGQSSHRVLVYDHDVVLLKTRCMLLRHAGFHADAVQSPEQFQARISQAEIPYGLVLLGHTVPHPEQDRIASSVANSSTLVLRPPELILPTQLIDDARRLLNEREKL